jgi:hypothetical protein
MAKFLVLARPNKPIPEKANIKGAREKWKALRAAGKAEVYEIIETTAQLSPSSLTCRITTS